VLAVSTVDCNEPTYIVDASYKSICKLLNEYVMNPLRVSVELQEHNVEL